MEHLRIGTLDEPPLQASKWSQVPVLLDIDEMTALFDHLGEFSLYQCASVKPLGQGVIGKDEFLLHYESYINNLKNGRLPIASDFQPWFSPAMSATPEALYTIPVGQGQQLIRIAKPIIQLQAHTFDYSPFDKKFRSMIFGSESIPWGIQFSYPQLFMNPTTKQVEATRNSPELPNSALFHSLQKWMRQRTIPTPFRAEGILYKVPIRLGKQCLTWINRHPQLIHKGIIVKVN